MWANRVWIRFKSSLVHRQDSSSVLETIYRRWLKKSSVLQCLIYTCIKYILEFWTVLLAYFTVAQARQTKYTWKRYIPKTCMYLATYEKSTVFLLPTTSLISIRFQRKSVCLYQPHFIHKVLFLNDWHIISHPLSVSGKSTGSFISLTLKYPLEIISNAH